MMTILHRSQNRKLVINREAQLEATADLAMTKIIKIANETRTRMKIIKRAIHSNIIIGIQPSNSNEFEEILINRKIAMMDQQTQNSRITMTLG